MDTSRERPSKGIAVDASHSVKNGVTEYRGVDLATGEEIFSRSIGNQTVNIGEFLAIVDAVKYIMENGYSPSVIYSDSKTAITWFMNKSTGSAKKCRDMQKAEIFLKVMAEDVDRIEVVHWDNGAWGETPADFGRK